MSSLTRAQRVSDQVTWFCGTWSFILVFALFTAAWVGFNLWHPFDGYPFILLNLVFTVIELFQGPLILMSENRQKEIERESVQSLHAKLDQIIGRLP